MEMRGVQDPAMVEHIVEEAVSALQSKRAHGVLTLDMRRLDNPVCDFFVICDAQTSPHIKSLADEVEHRVGTGTGEWPLRRSGLENAQWVVIDYFDVVVHIFSSEARRFYDLESLWSDALRMDYPDEE